MWDPRCSAHHLACLNRVLATQVVLGLAGLPHGGEGNKLAGRCGHRLWSEIQCKLEAISKIWRDTVKFVLTEGDILHVQLSRVPFPGNGEMGTF